MSESSSNLPDRSMNELFQEEMKIQTAALEQGLEALMCDGSNREAFSIIERAAHSLKGAALIMDVQPVADLAQAVEGYLTALQEKGKDLSGISLRALTEAAATLRQLIPQGGAEIRDTVIQGRHAIERSIAALLAGKVLPEKAIPGDKGTQLLKRKFLAKPPTNAPEAATNQESPNFDPSMIGLFFVDLETQTHLLTDGLLALEANARDSEALASLMRAAHSIKGAARVLGLTDLVELAHAIEDCFIYVQKNRVAVEPEWTDQMLAGVDIFAALVASAPSNIESWLNSERAAIQSITQGLRAHFALTASGTKAYSVEDKHEPQMPSDLVTRVGSKESSLKRLEFARQATNVAKRDRILRLTADYLTRLMGLAGELLVESRWLQPFADSLLQLKKSLYELSGIVDHLRFYRDEGLFGDEGQQNLLDLQRKSNSCRQSLVERLEELELFIRRHGGLSDRLYREVISSRMCPFAEGVDELPRMVRDLARDLNKKVVFEIIGRSTTIDRDILDKLQSPLQHLLRNAVDHGIETPDERTAKGKSAEGHIRLEARHRAGVLSITVSDDGRGVNLEQLRGKIVERKLVTASMAKQLTDAELLDFLFLPGFTTATHVTDISGRGVGLNVVQTMVHEVGGQVRVRSTEGSGMSFHLALPLTLSVLRSLLVVIAGEPYAFPLARIERALVIDRSNIQVIENRQYIKVEDSNIGLIHGYRILGFPPPLEVEAELSVVVLSDNFNYYGIVVDRLLGEKELVMQELDPRLGKVLDISCGALMEDGSPVLIVDVEDVVRSVDNLLSAGLLEETVEVERRIKQERRKRVLVVDDSITVREVECRILEIEGYEVDVAVNGVDGWNSVRIEDYDLVVTDVDMPRMNGIELVRLIKGDARLQHLPVMIVSYKERPEDRKLALEAGADYYLAKSSFHDDSFMQTVRELIGEPIKVSL